MNTRTPSPLSPWLRPILIGLAVGAVTATGLLLLFALLIYKLDLPMGAVTPLAVIAMGLGSLVGGIAVGLSTKEKGLLSGAVCGALLYLILLIAGLARTGDVALGYAAVKGTVMTVASAAGGVLGVNRRHP